MFQFKSKFGAKGGSSGAPMNGGGSGGQKGGVVKLVLAPPTELSDSLKEAELLFNGLIEPVTPVKFFK